MGYFGSGDKTQNLTDNQSGADASGNSSLANAVSATGSNVAAADLLQGSNKTVAGLLALQGGNSGSVQVTLSDSGAIDAAKAIAAQSNDLLKEALSQNAASGQSTSSLISGVVTQLKDLAETKTTDGQSQVNRTVLWIVLGLVVGVVLIFWRRKS